MDIGMNLCADAIQPKYVTVEFMIHLTRSVCVSVYNSPRARSLHTLDIYVLLFQMK